MARHRPQLILREGVHRQGWSIAFFVVWSAAARHRAMPPRDQPASPVEQEQNADHQAGQVVENRQDFSPDEQGDEQGDAVD